MTYMDGNRFYYVNGHAVLELDSRSITMLPDRMGYLLNESKPDDDEILDSGKPDPEDGGGPDVRNDEVEEPAP